jgi:hypothetical protein
LKDKGALVKQLRESLERKDAELQTKSLEVHRAGFMVRVGVWGSGKRGIGADKKL